jgi:DNA-binding HxlR family transcriptional regulator
MVNKKRSSLEVSSDQLQGELVEIKERIAALETIASLANRPVVEAWVKEVLKSTQGKKIMRHCEQPRTKDELRAHLNLASTQALDHHLRPLREDDLLQQRHNEEGKQTYEWSNLFKRLPAKAIEKLLS